MIIYGLCILIFAIFYIVRLGGYSILEGDNKVMSNSNNDITYNINLDQLSVINGYTGKFANIGTGKMIINGGKYKLIGSCKEATKIELEPQEQIELVCYNNDTNKELLVIGKSL